MVISSTDIKHLERCIQLAQQALDQGDMPFGSVLVDNNGQVLMEDHNRDNTKNKTCHPEFEIARWAAQNLNAQERALATVYTSGEHCPMCSAAHAMAGLGRIVYASSSAQFASWYQEWGVPLSPVNHLPIKAVAPSLEVAGPVPELAEKVRTLQHRYLQKSCNKDG